MALTFCSTSRGTNFEPDELHSLFAKTSAPVPLLYRSGGKGPCGFTLNTRSGMPAFTISATPCINTVRVMGGLGLAAVKIGLEVQAKVYMVRTKSSEV